MGSWTAVATVAVLACAASCARAEDAATAAPKDGPRLGKYLIHAYGAVGRPPLYLGAVVLEAGGKYKVLLAGDKPGGEGTYAYDAAKQAVTWKDGPYKEDQFGGEFTVELEGRQHKIRLKRTTVATSTLDEKK